MRLLRAELYRPVKRGQRPFDDDNNNAQSCRRLTNMAAQTILYTDTCGRRPSSFRAALAYVFKNTCSVTKPRQQSFRSNGKTHFIWPHTQVPVRNLIFLTKIEFSSSQIKRIINTHKCMCVCVCALCNTRSTRKSNDNPCSRFLEEIRWANLDQMDRNLNCV